MASKNNSKTRVLAALLSCPTFKEAAEQAGVSVRTVYSYLREQDFKREYDEGKALIVSEATAFAQRCLSPSVKVLLRIAEDEAMPTGARVQAARSLLEYGIRLAEVNDILRRIEGLEARSADVEGPDDGAFDGLYGPPNRSTHREE